MRVLVTGGAGFIGSQFVLSWIKSGLGEVLNFDKLTYAANLNHLAEVETDPRYCFVRGDITDQALVASTLSSFRPEAIVHFAAESHVDRSIDGPAEFVNTNVVGTVGLLEAIRKYLKSGDELRKSFRYLHVSTDEVYGSLAENDQPATEQYKYLPSNPYSASKAASDHFVRSYFRTYGLPVLLSHCSNNFGPHQYREKFIPNTVLHALHGLPVKIYGDGRHRRDWIYVSDHCRALQKILLKGELGESYNIGAHNEISNLETACLICDLIDKMKGPLEIGARRKLIQFSKDRPGHDWRYALDNTKITKQLGWAPEIDFLEGLRMTIAWYSKHHDGELTWKNISSESQAVL